MLRPYEPKRDHRPVCIRPPEHIEPEAAAKGGVQTPFHRLRPPSLTHHTSVASALQMHAEVRGGGVEVERSRRSTTEQSTSKLVRNDASSASLWDMEPVMAEAPA